MAEVTNGQQLRIYTGKQDHQFYSLPVEQTGISRGSADETVTGTKTFSANNVHQGDESFSGSNLFTGTNTHDGVEIYNGPVIFGSDSGQIVAISTTLENAEIVGNTAGTIGHADGAEIVAGPAATHSYVFIGMHLAYDFDTAAYGGGADDMVVCYGGGGGTLSGATVDANLLTAVVDKQVYIYPLTTAGVPVEPGVGINIKGTAYTDPGTAAGILRITTYFRVIEHGQ